MIFWRTPTCQTLSKTLVISSAMAWVAADLLKALVILSDKAGTGIAEFSKSEFSEQFSANNFNLSDVEDNASGPLNKGNITDSDLLETLSVHQKSGESNLWKMIDYFALIAWAGLTDTRMIIIPSAMIIRLFDWFWRLILLVQKKRVISLGYCGSTSSWKSWG